MTIQEFIAKHGIKMIAERTDSNPNMVDSTWRADHWKVRFSFGKRRMTTYFSMGYGHNGKAPEADDVLNCLISDCSVIDQTFEDWAGDFGYDTDSRKAEKTYKACIKTGNRLLKFLGFPLFDELNGCERL
ncbi:MAG TPA: hypothetical protein VHD33_00235 [Legionellaceae bacterium]|nr:hypothetical protein [Legionellaceae bacterium]